MNARDAILAAVRSNLPKPAVPLPEIPGSGRQGVKHGLGYKEHLNRLPEVAGAPSVDEPLLPYFRRQLEAMGGRSFEVADAAAARAKVVELFPEAKVVCSAVPEVQGTRKVEDVCDPHELNDVDVGIVRSPLAVAEAGAVWVTQAELAMNALAVLSQHLVVLLDPVAIVETIHDAYDKIDLAASPYGVFLAGPSATGDIEGVIIHGAQAPEPDRSASGVSIAVTRSRLMPRLDTAISPGLWAALLEHAETTHQPIAHLIRKALVEYLKVTHHTLYQVSTSTALVEGIYQGAVRVGTLREHGDLGLGTFEDLDGEMVVVDGRFFQVRSDGSVRECGDDELSPFAVVTRFEPDVTVTMEHCPDLGNLNAQFDGLRNTDNVFFALRVDGLFEYVHTRAMCRTEEGVPLVQAAAVQPEFEFRDIVGTLVGFWTPEYAKRLNVPGYHLHFLSADRKKGGHLLQCRGSNLSLQIQRETVMALALPETEDFLKADLRRDPTADLAQAEGEKS